MASICVVKFHFPKGKIKAKRPIGVVSLYGIKFISRKGNNKSISRRKKIKAKRPTDVVSLYGIKFISRRGNNKSISRRKKIKAKRPTGMASLCVIKFHFPKGKIKAKRPTGVVSLYGINSFPEEEIKQRGLPVWQASVLLSFISRRENNKSIFRRGNKAKRPTRMASLFVIKFHFPKGK